MTLFSKKLKMADLIVTNNSLILTLDRFGIPLGFGEKSVEDVCKQSNVSVNLFLMICNVYSFDNYIPDKQTITDTDLSQLIPYLLASHKYYMEKRLPHIEHHLHGVADMVGEKYGKILLDFFSDYKNEFHKHFSYEEEIVFPYMQKLENGQRDKNYSIQKFVESHSNIEEALTDLTQIIYKYLPSSVMPDDSIELIFDILQLTSDLGKHSLIEDKILVPYVETLERRYK